MSFPRYPAYKDSGVEWLGEVPGHWDCDLLSHVASCNEETLSENTPDDYEIEYVEISGVEAGRGIVEVSAMPFGSAPSRARRVLRDGDVLISTVRTYLRAIAQVNAPPDNMIASTGFAVLRPRSVQSRYLGYACHAEGFVSQVIARSVGVSYPAINASELVRLPIPLPPFAEQIAIATFLDHETAKIDALVAEQERLIELLKEKRQAVISHAVTKGLDSSVPMKDSGVEWLGEVPAHWEVTTIKRIVSTPVTDGPHETPVFLDEGIPFVSAEAVSSGRIDFDRIRGFISVEDHRRFSQKYIPQRDDIFMIKSGATTGVSAIVETDLEFNIWSPLAVIRCGPDVLPRFALHFIRSRNFLEGVTLGWSFGTQQNIGMGVIENLSIVVPPLAAQREIVQLLDKYVAQADELIGEAEQAITILQERRTALISAAVTGQIDVRGFVTEKEAA